LLLACPKRLQIVGQQLHDKLFVAGMTPAIAIEATDQHFTVMVDFYKRPIAAGPHLGTYLAALLKAL
jgi:hypothetical protein